MPFVDTVMLSDVCCRHSFNFIYRLFMESLQHDAEMKTHLSSLESSFQCWSHMFALEKEVIVLTPVYEIAAAWPQT